MKKKTMRIGAQVFADRLDYSREELLRMLWSAKMIFVLQGNTESASKAEAAYKGICGLRIGEIVEKLGK